MSDLFYVDSDALKSTSIPTRLPQGSLLPIASHASQRYNMNHRSSSIPMTIQPGQFTRSRETEPAYLPHLWSSWVHPEGQLYFHRSGSLRIVTDAYLYDPTVYAKVSFWAKFVEECLLNEGLHGSKDLELYIEISGEDCLYYLVDSSSKTMFWLAPVDPEDLGLTAVVSASHLRLVLEEQFWSHVERFPSHFGGLDVSVVDELISVFCHAQVDQMTSTVSTSFYSKEACAEYIKVLKTSRQFIADDKQTCLVARLWSFIASQRVTTHFGQRCTRLSRDQAILYDAPSGTWLASIFSALSFRTSDLHLKSLESLYVDRLVYVEQWKPFIAARSKEWFVSFIIATALTIFAILSAAFLHFSTAALPAIVLLCLSMISSIILLHRYARMSEQPSVEDVLSHFETVFSEEHSFAGVAFMYSLPSALTLWGMLAMAMNALFSIYQSWGLGAGLASTTAAMLLFYGSQYALSDISLPTVNWRLNSSADDESIV